MMVECSRGHQKGSVFLFSTQTKWIKYEQALDSLVKLVLKPRNSFLPTLSIVGEVIKIVQLISNRRLFQR